MIKFSVSAVNCCAGYLVFAEPLDDVKMAYAGVPTSHKSRSTLQQYNELQSFGVFSVGQTAAV